MQSLDRLYGYTEVLINCRRMQSLNRTCSRRHLESSQSLIKSWSIGRCSAFKSDQPEPSVGPTVYPNWTSVDHPAMANRQALGLYRKSAHDAGLIQCRATDAQLDVQLDAGPNCRPRSDFLTAVLLPSYRRRITVFDAYRRLSTVFEAYHLMTHHITTYDLMSYSLFLLPVFSLCI